MTYLSSLLKQTDYHFNDKFINVDVLDEGILRLSPSHQTNRHIILSCAIHGNETAPIEMMQDLLTQAENGELKLDAHFLLIFGNAPAMREEKRFIEFNLNRLFNRKHLNYQKTWEGKRANVIEQHVEKFVHDKQGEFVHLDLHTAIAPSHHKTFCLCPASKKGKITSKEQELLAALGLQAIVSGSTEMTTFSAYTQQLFGENGFSATVELGKVMPFGENNHDDFSTPLRAIRELLTTQNFITDEKERPRHYHVKRALVRDHDDYELFLTIDDINFTKLKEGEPLEKTKEGIKQAGSNEFLIFPNQHVKIGQRSGLILSSEDLS